MPKLPNIKFPKLKPPTFCNALRTLYKGTAHDDDLLVSYMKIFGPVLPYKYDNTVGKKKFYPIGPWGKCRLILFYTLSWLECARIFYVTYQSLYLGMNAQYSKFLGLNFLVLFLSISTPVHIRNGLLNTEDQLCAYNTWHLLKPDNLPAFNFALRSLLATAFFIASGFGLLFIFIPVLPIFFLSSAGLDPDETSFFVLFIFLILELLRFYMFLGLHVLCNSMNLSGVYSLVSINLNRLLENPDLGSKEIQVFKSLTIYNRIVYNGLGRLLVEIKILGYGQTICSIVMLIEAVRNAEVTGLIVGFAFFRASIFRMRQLLSHMSMIGSACEELFEKWKKCNAKELDSNARSLTAQIMSSLIPLNPTIGSMYEVKGSTELSFYDACLSNVVGILIELGG